MIILTFTKCSLYTGSYLIPKQPSKEGKDVETMAHRRETTCPEAHSHEKQGWESNPYPSGSFCCVLITTSLECLPQSYFS